MIMLFDNCYTNRREGGIEFVPVIGAVRPDRGPDMRPQWEHEGAFVHYAALRLKKVSPGVAVFTSVIES